MTLTLVLIGVISENLLLQCENFLLFYQSTKIIKFRKILVLSSFGVQMFSILEKLRCFGVKIFGKFGVLHSSQTVTEIHYASRLANPNLSR